MKSLPPNLYRAEQVRELDRIAIEQQGIAGYELMSRAGQDAFNCLVETFPETQSIAVFCGAGNNAGDAYVVARLAMRKGLKVSLYSLINQRQLKGDALTAYQQFLTAGGQVLSYQYYVNVTADVIVDGLLGTGLDRAVSGIFADVIHNINTSQKPVLALDIPSGLNADSGAVMGISVCADLTVTFIALKQGLFTGSAADYTGVIKFSSLQVPDLIYQELHVSAKLITTPRFESRSRCSHKGSNGHVLVIGGDSGYSGAAVMAAHAAARVGAGLVSVATRAAHASVLNQNRPELMCHGVETVQQLQPLLDNATVIVFGPGLGTSDWAQALYDAVINIQKPLLIDADGLNLLAQKPQSGNNWIITPHPGEAGRLLDCNSNEIQHDRFAATNALYQKFQATVVLKGSGTLVFDEQTCFINPTGNPGMGSGGFGDVLSGVIAGLIAQGYAPGIATRNGVYIHGEAADQAAKDGERGLLASDLMPYLRKRVNQG